MDTLRNILPITNYDVLIFSETNLSEDVCDGELGCTNFNVYRKDRSALTSNKISGGGVLVAIHASLRSWMIPTSVVNVEYVLTGVKCGHESILIGGVYIPPGQPASLYSDFCGAVEEVLLQSTEFTSVILVGDFNLPNFDWINLVNRNGCEDSSQSIIDLASVYDLKQRNFISNDRGVILDLVLTSQCGMDVTPAVEVLLTPDRHHPPVEMSLKVSAHEYESGSYMLNFKRCNLPNVFNWLQTVDYPIETDNVENNFTDFCTDLGNIIKQNCPMKFVGKAKFPRWFTKELKELIVLKKLAHKQYKHTLSEGDYMRFQGIRRRCKHLSRTCYNSYIEHVDQGIPGNINLFWSHVNNIKKQPSLPSKMKLDGNEAHNPTQVCELFARFFSSIYRLPLSLPAGYDIRTNVSLSSCYVTCSEVVEILENLNHNKGPGPDGIPPGILKFCSGIIAPHLTIYFNLLMRSGIFPNNLKLGYITPLFKSGDPSDVRNYRPIIIQSSLAKVFEAVVLKCISFNFKSVMVPEQHGFRQGKSTSTNLAVFQDFIMSAFSRGHQVDSIYLDFSKAFDRVSHVHLVQKLKVLGINGQLWKWLNSYLMDRWLVVRFGGAESFKIPALSGVPQGSLLGPALFNLFINDIVEILPAKCLLFADDIKIYGEVTSMEDANILQTSLDIISKWCSANEMSLNLDKCLQMTYHRILTPVEYAYSINGSILRRVTKTKDLGIIMVPSLSFEEHLLHVCRKANAVLGFIIRISRNGLSIATLKFLFILLVRPHLEYGSVIWNPYQIGHCSLLEGVQTRLIRHIGVRLGYRFTDVPKEQLRLDLGLPTLEVRRNILDLMFLFKIMNAAIDCPELMALIDFRTNRTTRSQECFSRRHIATSYSFYSLVPRLLRAGNAISSRVDFFGQSEYSFRRELNASALVPLQD